MSEVRFNIELSPELRAVMAAMTPQALGKALVVGLDEAAQLTVGSIQAKRLSGRGPFPPVEGRLGVRSGRLRGSIRASKAVVGEAGASVTIGTNVKYAAIHEFGGTYTRKVKPGTVRLATDRAGNLVKRGNLATFAKRRNSRAREVAFTGGGSYTVNVPARAPIGHGVADNEGTFVSSIEKAVRAALGGEV